MSLSSGLTTLAQSADAEGIAIDWDIVEDTPPFVWISDFQRAPSAPPGTGRTWLTRLIAAAHAEGHAVRLCCTWWNTALVDHYVAIGFRRLFQDGDDVHLEAAPRPSI